MKYIFANWKMYLSVESSVALSKDLATMKIGNNAKIAVFPSSLSFREVATELGGSGISVGAQSVYQTDVGAYTGVISALMFREAGAEYALVGHSERRHVFGETEADVRAQLEACVRVGIVPVLCIGETLEDRENDASTDRLKYQLEEALSGWEEFPEMIIAYEPVWAIAGSGLGEPCDPSLAVERHIFIEDELKCYTDRDIPILYGGSVNEGNVVSYMESDHIDGVLVGSASTKISSFSTIIDSI
jgi:triosephosphate isomerase (TIM)